MVKRSRATLDRAYGALSHPIRREMLDLLRAGPARVTDLAEPFAISLAAASKHIRALESAGLVSRTIAGRDHLLRIEPRGLVAASEWIERYRSFWDQRLDALEAHLRRKR